MEDTVSEIELDDIKDKEFEQQPTTIISFRIPKNIKDVLKKNNISPKKLFIETYKRIYLKLPSVIEELRNKHK